MSAKWNRKKLPTSPSVRSSSFQTSPSIRSSSSVPKDPIQYQKLKMNYLRKLNVIPIRRGYWGAKFGVAHTVPCKVTGKCGSVRFRLVPAPRGTGIVAAKVPKKVLTYAGLKDVYTSSKGNTRTLGNFVKATYEAVVETYRYLTPDLWPQTRFQVSPYQEFSEFLKVEGSKNFAPSAPKKSSDREDRD